jgi:hypothetical protein
MQAAENTDQLGNAPQAAQCIEASFRDRAWKTSLRRWIDARAHAVSNWHVYLNNRICVFCGCICVFCG